MQTVFDTRRTRLRLLRDKYKTWGDFNEAIGWPRTDPRLSQIHSQSIRSGRGTPFVMGDSTARHIEAKLGLVVGWMDTPPSYAELDPDPMIADLLQVARQLREENRTYISPSDIDKAYPPVK